MDIITLFLKMQIILQLFLELLQVSGGDLNIANVHGLQSFTGGMAVKQPFLRSRTRTL
jgi:hypothetical protein